MDVDWIFDGGRPCLDLVNTKRDRRLGGRELLTTPAALAEWLTLAGLLTARAHATPEDLTAALELREAIDRLGRGVAHAPDAQIVNLAARTAPIPQLRREHGEFVRITQSAAPPVTAALGVLAVDAIDLVATGLTVRICAADDCGVRFADLSPRHNRQWCSMSRCGNRAKARAHYARRTAQ